MTKRQYYSVFAFATWSLKDNHESGFAPEATHDNSIPPPRRSTIRYQPSTFLRITDEDAESAEALVSLWVVLA